MAVKSESVVRFSDDRQGTSSNNAAAKVFREAADWLSSRPNVNITNVEYTRTLKSVVRDRISESGAYYHTELKLTYTL